MVQIKMFGEMATVPVGATAKLGEGGQAIISPTKVGYVIVTCDAGGLEKKFDLKQRPKRKPGVVLATEANHVYCLAKTTEKIRLLYTLAYKQYVLLGCILPWLDKMLNKHVPSDCVEMVTDPRQTSCFVVRYGKISETIVETMWHQHSKLCFASSANPSGKGNRGKLECVGDRILGGADYIIEADDYVTAQQPNTDEGTRMEQGVMVSFVDDDGKLLDHPTIIRHGLDLQKIKDLLTAVFGGYTDSHGSYH